MALARRGGAQGSGAGTANLTINFTALENDVVLLFGFGDLRANGSFGNADVVSAGWTQIETSLGGSYVRGTLFRKVMSASPDASAVVRNGSFNSTTGAFGIIWLVEVWSGANTTTPEDAACTKFNWEGTSQDIDTPSITTVTANAVVFTMGGNLGNNPPTAAPSGYTNFQALGVDGSTDGAGAGIASKLVAAAGAENPGVFTGPDNWGCGFTYALRPGADAAAKSLIYRPHAASFSHMLVR